MIHYQLRCSAGHEFDGWYKDSAAFDRLVAGGMVDCPVCGDSKVGRALMAPRIAKGRPDAPPPGPAASPAAMPAGGERQVAAGPMPAQVIALLQKLRAEVEKNCDYVGPDFADEARRMHRGESAHRGIYGEASPDEAEALRDEGIEIGQLPWVPRADG
jgi:hypothetical protein